MLLKFSFENFLSFKGRNEIDFQAGTIKEYNENIFIPISGGNYSLLKSIGIYGHNSTGKSNVIKAFTFMRDFVLNSSKESNAHEKIMVQPFRLSTTTDNKASFFEVLLVFEGVRYRYGFSVSQTRVEEEWLFKADKKKEDQVFIRAGQEFRLYKGFNDEKQKTELLTGITRSNSLFISVLTQFNILSFHKITKWFSDILIAKDDEYLDLINFSARLLSDVAYRKWMNDIIRFSELGIESLDARLSDIGKKGNYSSEFLAIAFKEEISQYKVITKHKIFDDNHKNVDSIYFDLIENESLGTQKYFGLLGTILLSIREQRLIIIDEIDARLHSILFENLVKLFNSARYNNLGGQLIFTGHNPHVLRKGMRRDQMYFVEKDEYGASKINSLYKEKPKVRNDASFDKDYLKGEYGHTPPSLGMQLDLF